MTTYRVLAKRTDNGWDLHVRNGRQKVAELTSRSLTNAEDTVRGYLQDSVADVEVVPQVDLPDGYDVAAVRKRVKAARKEYNAASVAQLETMVKLRDAGLSMRDVGTVMGVSQPRVQQLLNKHNLAQLEK